MKILTLLFAAGLGFITNAHSAEALKPQLQLSAKKQILDADYDKFGKARKARSSNQKTYTLRVELYNATSTTVAESVLTGTALVSRVFQSNSQIVKESLGEIKVPDMKPNEKITLDLGKIELREVEWRNRKFEENLEEWKVTCSQGNEEIGTTLSSEKYVVVVKEAVDADKKKSGPAKRGPKKFPKR